MVAALSLSACRVEVAVDVAMQPDGSGTLTVTLTADADVVAEAGGLERDLRLDDLESAGWTSSGLTDTPDGGVRLALAHEFRAPEELSALLASLNGTQGPFRSVAFARQVRSDVVGFTVSGAGQAVDGLASFADADLVDVIGATPYAADILDAGLAPSEAVHVALAISLPGTVDGSTGTRTDRGVEWIIPLDGTPVDLATTATWSRDAGGGHAVLAIALQVLFFVWLGVVALGFVAVVLARRRRHRLAPVLMVNHPTRRPGSPSTVQVRRSGWDESEDGDGDVDEGDGWDDRQGPDEPPSPPRRPSFPLPEH